MKTWIGLGSNLGDGTSKIAEALRRISSIESLRVLRRSSLYLTEPWGYASQDAFTNAVAELDSGLAPLELLSRLHQIERAMGRHRNFRRWGPRGIDLDILLVEEQILVLEGLTVPHPRMHRRAFVLCPLAELEPTLLIPGRGSVLTCLARIGDQGARRLPGSGAPGAAEM